MAPEPLVPSRSAGAVPDTTGSFSVAWSVARPGFDPHRGPEHLSIPFLAPVYDRLVRLHADGSLGPMLAERWAYTDRGRRLSIELRSDARFHDGSPLDVGAVRASLLRGRSPVASAAMRRHLGQIARIELADDHRLELDVTDRAAGLPALLATAAGMIVDTRTSTEPLLRPRGSGPFVLADVEAGGRHAARFVRATNHWDADTPRAGEFSIREIADHGARLDALLSGDVDIVDVRGAASADAARHATAGRIRIASYPSTTTVTLQFDLRSDVFHDVRLRRAVSLAIDRSPLVALYGEQAEPIGQCLPPTSPAHDPAVDATPPQDLDEARRLVARAGGSERPLRLLQFEAVEPATSVLTRVADDLRSAGFDVELTALTPTDLVAAWQAGGFDLRVTHATAMPGDAFELERRLNPAQQPGDLARFSTDLPPLVERLHDQRMSSAAVEELHREINSLMIDGAVFVELCRLRCDIAAAPHIVGDDRIPYACFNLFDASEITVAVGP